MKKKKAFGEMFEVVDGNFYPENNSWYDLISKTENDGWNNPSDVFRGGGKSISGTIVGFHIPPNSKGYSPKFAFIKTKSKRVAVKF